MSAGAGLEEELHGRVFVAAVFIDGRSVANGGDVRAQHIGVMRCRFLPQAKENISGGALRIYGNIFSDTIGAVAHAVFTSLGFAPSTSLIS